jgi:hypothetical protein
MIPPSAGMLLDELLTAERSHENVEKLQKEVLREELIQKAVQADKATTKARGGDPSTTARPDVTTSTETKNKEPVDEDAASLGC